MSPPNKKANMGMMKIGTHNGTFHCDEVLACYMLKLLPEYKDADIIRSRDTSVLDTCDIVVDVGGVYDVSKHRYDHHQRTFEDTMSTIFNGKKKWCTKLSSAGLVYAHFGHRIIGEILGLDHDSPKVDILFDKIYENFMEEVDAIDNGISTHDEKPRYLITTNLSSRVGHLNPAWNDSQKDFEICFKKAMKLVGEEFLDRVNFYGKSWLLARDIVQQAVEERMQVHKSGEIILLKIRGCPWKDHLLFLEEKLKIEKPVKFVLYEDEHGHWRVQCVPVACGSFQSRLPLLKAWRGVRDEDLAELSGIPGCIFVHASGFIGGNRTKEGALKMAVTTLQEAANGDM